MTRAPGWVAAAFVAAAGIGACTNVALAPDAVVAIAFDTLPFPSVVAGDTMRDTLGRAAALHAVAYNSAGAQMVNPPLSYVALDTGVDISAAGYLVATTRTSGSVRVVASSGTFQSLPRTVLVTRAPRALAVSGAAVDTVFYVVPDAATNVSPTLTVKLTGDSAGTPVGVPGFLVTWALSLRGQSIGKNDTTLASVWSDASSRTSSLVDTTATDGTASRVLRIRANALPSAADSFFVTATTRYRGVPVAGSPVKFVIHFRPKSAR
jgi:hypothetical protein